MFERAQAAYIANFDSFSEGAIGASFVDGGITFLQYDNGISGPKNFCIEYSGASLSPHESTPNVLAFGGWVPGAGVGLGRFKYMDFTIPELATSVSLDVWCTGLANEGGRSITLFGYSAGQVVSSSTFNYGIGFGQHSSLSLNTGPFDAFRLAINGPVDADYGFVAVDNVTVQAVPEPATWLTASILMAISAAAACSKRFARDHSSFSRSFASTL
jgi:hypothetical protein